MKAILWSALALMIAQNSAWAEYAYRLRCQAVDRTADVDIDMAAHTVTFVQAGVETKYNIFAVSDSRAALKLTCYEAPAWSPPKPAYAMSLHRVPGSPCDRLKMGVVENPLVPLGTLDEGALKDEYCCTGR